MAEIPYINKEDYNKRLAFKNNEAIQIVIESDALKNALKERDQYKQMYESSRRVIKRLYEKYDIPTGLATLD